MQNTATHKYRIEKKGEHGQHLYLYPTQKHTHTLVWLHGLGDSANGYLDVFQEPVLCPASTKIVLLTAPVRAVTINFGMKMPSWFDFRSFSITPDNFDKAISVDEIKESLRVITFVLEEEVAQLEGKSRNVFIGGFSQGACMSLHAALQFPQRLGGVLAFSGFLFPITQVNEKNANTPLLISHGLSDQLLPWSLCEKTYQALNQKAHAITWNKEVGLEHGFSDKSWKVFRAFLADQMRSNDVVEQAAPQK